MSATTLYWVLTLDSIGNTCITFSILFFILTVVTIIFINIHNECCLREDEWSINKYCYSLIPLLLSIIFVTLATFIPNTKQMATILIVPKIVKSDFVQKDLPKEAKELYGLAKGYLAKELMTTTKQK